MKKRIPEYLRPLDDRRAEYENADIERINHPEHGILTQYAPKSRTFIGSWSDGSPRYFYRSKNVNIYTTSLEGKKADKICEEESDHRI